MILFLSINGICIVACVLMMVRNKRVHDYRKELLDLASTKARHIIHSGGNWMEPYDYFESVSYEEMMVKFWKPLRSFYDESKFKVTLSDIAHTQ